MPSKFDTQTLNKVVLIPDDMDEHVLTICNRILRGLGITGELGKVYNFGQMRDLLFQKFAPEQRLEIISSIITSFALNLDAQQTRPVDTTEITIILKLLFDTRIINEVTFMTSDKKEEISRSLKFILRSIDSEYVIAIREEFGDHNIFRLIFEQ